MFYSYNLRELEITKIKKLGSQGELNIWNLGVFFGWIKDGERQVHAQGPRWFCYNVCA